MSDFTGLHKALYAFWSGFTSDDAKMAAYYTGHVPKIPGSDQIAVEMPYITFEAVDCPPLGSTVLTATGWFKSSSGYNGRIKAAEFFDEVKGKIPPQGTRVMCDGGFVLLYPNNAAFLTYMDDPDDENIVGARVSYEAYFYH